MTAFLYFLSLSLCHDTDLPNLKCYESDKVHFTSTVMWVWWSLLWSSKSWYFWRGYITTRIIIVLHFNGRQYFIVQEMLSCEQKMMVYVSGRRLSMQQIWQWCPDYLWNTIIFIICDGFWLCYSVLFHDEQCPVWAWEHCRISPPRFLAKCHNRRLNQGGFCVVFLLRGCV